jgi:hypothetical protein
MGNGSADGTRWYERWVFGFGTRYGRASDGGIEPGGAQYAGMLAEGGTRAADSRGRWRLGGWLRRVMCCAKDEVLHESLVSCM